MSIKNLDFSLLGSFFGDEKEKPVCFIVYFYILRFRIRANQFICFIVYFYVLRFRIRASHGGIFPWNGDGGEYLLFIEELLSKPS